MRSPNVDASWARMGNLVRPSSDCPRRHHRTSDDSHLTPLSIFGLRIQIQSHHLGHHTATCSRGTQNSHMPKGWISHWPGQSLSHKGSQPILRTNDASVRRGTPTGDSVRKFRAKKRRASEKSCVIRERVAIRGMTSARSGRTQGQVVRASPIGQADGTAGGTLNTQTVGGRCIIRDVHHARGLLEMEMRNETQGVRLARHNRHFIGNDGEALAWSRGGRSTAHLAPLWQR